MNWTCDEMAIESLPGDKSATRLTASGTVIFHLLEDDRATAHGTCDKAVYTYSVSGNKTNEIVELTGDPVLVTTNGIFENPTLIYDRTQNKVTAPGRYRIHGYTQATNIVQLPRIPKR
jgi:lipopolysaccharide export system protein LptA